ncbi:B12-binding domain-containing radical SAM protein [Paenibacillus sp.]|uniref:B12-binding domain-containing radical SAM protein n=1 Tax=Paenibacillus sp. TaxID=58172 RepID=UPI002D4CC137|nr:B12-binding domain-containing radical SAM protein [Paenibacillus sp.]HZG54885.1 B12-binding domain-containing radical SAM protein [Paenibacillus sp.]
MKTVLATLNAKYIHMSLALRYLKAYSERDFDIELAEYTIKDPAMNVVSDLFRHAPDVVGFSCYIWNIEETIGIIRMLKKVLPRVRVVLGGPEVSYDTQYWLERVPEVDFVVMGEGEETLHQLLGELRDGTEKFHFVFGLAYRGRDGSVVLNPGRPKAELDALPSPHYFADDVPQLPTRVVYFETSRGCPFSCQFCLSSIEVGVRYFDIERTKRDLLHLIRSGARLIKFVDRTFNIKRDYALEIFQFLIDHHGGSCVFQFEITADIMRPEVIAFLSEHAPPGVFRFEIGVQSTNDATNEIIQRRQNFAKLSRTVTMIRESGKIDQHLDLIAGLPEEDYASFRKTFNDVFALRPEELQLGFLKMLRGTGVRARAAEHGYVYMDHAPYEILGNDVLPFADIVRIKQAEDVLEKYWNAHRADATVRYLIERVFPSAWDFFQGFGAYWESRGWERIGHQLEDLFVRLREFLADVSTGAFALDLPSAAGDAADAAREASGAAGDTAAAPDDARTASPAPALRAIDLDVVDGLMKLDYFRQHKYRPRKLWWDMALTPEEHAYWMRRLAERPEDVGDAFAALRLSERELHKQVMLDRVPFDLAVYLAEGVVRIGPGAESLLIARFSGDADRRADIYALPLAVGAGAH